MTCLCFSMVRLPAVSVRNSFPRFLSQPTRGSCFSGKPMRHSVSFRGLPSVHKSMSSNSGTSVRCDRVVRFLDNKGDVHSGFPSEDGQYARAFESDRLRDSNFDSLRQWGVHHVESLPVVSVSRLLAPVPMDPAPAIYAIGLNYRKHAEEANLPIPPEPVVFMKNPRALCNPGDVVKIPKILQSKPEVDYEAELAFVVGRDCKDVTERNAWDYILGYTCANDLSARRCQLGKRSGGQWCRSKSFDGFMPLGPCLDLNVYSQSRNIQCSVNGRVLQDSSTEELIFSVPEILSFISQGTTILAGTVVITGTPKGVGFSRKPPIYLEGGDVVSVSIEGVGVLSNRIENE
eukprot:Rmarinus@m.3086